ncbi:MAG: CAP domain-containing protein [Solirubrobacterales bacterium]
MPAITRHLNAPALALVACALAALAMLAALVPSDAQAATACKRYGDVQPQDIGRKEARRAVTCLVNRERNQHGRGDLNQDYRLVDAAVYHSSYMARKNCFSHQCPGEPSLLDRLRKANYLHGGLSRWAYGENIAYGIGPVGTPEAIVRGWMNSPPHRDAILSGTFRDIGVGFQSRGGKGFYTADFGLRIG